MKTKITKTGDTAVISMDGRLNVEIQEPLRDRLSKLATDANMGRDQTPRKIIFDFQNLEFVGSSGISSFVQTLRDFNTRSKIKPRYCNVSSEFQKIIRAFDEDAGFEFFEDVEIARRSFDC